MDIADNLSSSSACEACKRKKCKCDREVPTCRQCEYSQLVCKYSESNKRGIPTGYLGLLEQRLQRTEEALYKTLSELKLLKIDEDTSNNSTIPELVSRGIFSNKQARMEEWKEYPLESREDVERWQKYMRTNAISTRAQPSIESDHGKQNKTPTPPKAAMTEDRSSPYRDIELDLLPDLMEPPQGHPAGITDQISNIGPSLCVQSGSASSSEEIETAEEFRIQDAENWQGQQVSYEEPQLKQSQHLASQLKHIYY